MATQLEATAVSGTPMLMIPALEAGDQLTRAEFERRYEAMPGRKKAELIDGVVYMPSPVSMRHSNPQSKMTYLLVAYESATPGTQIGDNATVRLDHDNEPQPDGLLRIETQCGGQSRLGTGEFVEGPPEMIVEIASSTVSFDLHAKLNVYRRTGVLEYVVWRVQDADIDWFVLREGRYDRLSPDEAGVFCSEVFPGFWLDRTAALRGDAAAMLATLQRGIATPEHAAFVARLQQVSAATRK